MVIFYSYVKLPEGIEPKNQMFLRRKMFSSCAPGCTRSRAAEELAGFQGSLVVPLSCSRAYACHMCHHEIDGNDWCMHSHATWICWGRGLFEVKMRMFLGLIEFFPASQKIEKTEKTRNWPSSIPLYWRPPIRSNSNMRTCVPKWMVLAQAIRVTCLDQNLVLHKLKQHSFLGVEISCTLILTQCQRFLLSQTLYWSE